MAAFFVPALALVADRHPLDHQPLLHQAGEVGERAAEPSLSGVTDDVALTAVPRSSIASTWRQLPGLNSCRG